MAKNTRIDVEINTQNAQQSLRQLANDVSRINNQINNQSSSSTANVGSNRVSDVQSTINDLRAQLNKKEEQIRREFGDVRKSNLQELEDFTQRHKQGKISDDDFNQYREGFYNNQLDTFIQEREAVVEEQQRTNELIEELISRQDQNTQDQIESAQRDNSEHSPKGILRELFEKRSDLMQQRMDATSETELKRINKDLEKTNRQISKKSGGLSLSDTITRTGDIGETIASGDAGGMMGAGIGLMGKAGVWGLVAMAAYKIGDAVVGTLNERTKAVASLLPYRALGGNEAINQSISNTDYVRYGIEDQAAFLEKRKELLLSSGNYRAGSASNTMFAQKLEKGYGIESVAGVSSLERQDKYLKSTSENIVEMINVLGAIKGGSISKDDFTRVNEKVLLMNRLQQGQTSRQEKFDNNQVLGLMTAFTKMGGEGDDQRAGEFIEGTLGAMREGGSKNMMMLKHQFAMDANPSIANDPAALSRMIEEGTDPNYIVSTLKGLNKISGNNKQNKHFLYKEYFSNLTPSMREKLMKASESEDILGNIKGLGLGNAQIASEQSAGVYARQSVTGTDEIIGDIKKSVQEGLEIARMGWNTMTEWITGNAPVTVRNTDKSAKKNNIPK